MKKKLLDTKFSWTELFLSNYGQRFSSPPIIVRQIWCQNFKSAGEPRYPRSFYPRIRLVTFETLVKKAKFLVKMCLFICEFSIRGPKKWDVSTANNEVHLYLLFICRDRRWKKCTCSVWTSFPWYYDGANVHVPDKCVQFSLSFPNQKVYKFIVKKCNVTLEYSEERTRHDT